jgi:hypothetical protein
MCAEEKSFSGTFCKCARENSEKHSPKYFYFGRVLVGERVEIAETKVINDERITSWRRNWSVVDMNWGKSDSTEQHEESV